MKTFIATAETKLSTHVVRFTVVFISLNAFYSLGRNKRNMMPLIYLKQMNGLKLPQASTYILRMFHFG